MPNPGCAHNFYQVMLDCWQLEEKLRPTFPELRQTLIKISPFSRADVERLLGDSFEEVAKELDDANMYADPDADDAPGDPLYLQPSPRSSSDEGAVRGVSVRTRESIANFTPLTIANSAFSPDATYDMGSAAPGTFPEADDMAVYDQAEDGPPLNATSFSMAASLPADDDDQAVYDQAEDVAGTGSYLDPVPDSTRAGSVIRPSPTYQPSPAYALGSAPEPAFDAEPAYALAEDEGAVAGGDIYDEGPRYNDGGETPYGEVPAAGAAAIKPSANGTVSPTGMRPLSAEYEPAAAQKSEESITYATPTANDADAASINPISREISATSGAVSIGEEAVEIVAADFV